MNDRRILAFLAYAASVGKANLNDGEKELLSRLARRWVRVGERVRRRATVDTSGDAVTDPTLLPLTPFNGLPQFAGSVASVNEDDTVRVNLDAAIQVPSDGGVVVFSTSIVVPITWVELEPPATAPTPPPA